jgi:hypothetical protein
MPIAAFTQIEAAVVRPRTVRPSLKITEKTDTCHDALHHSYPVVQTRPLRALVNYLQESERVFLASIL